MNQISNILSTDSYKFSHFQALPTDVEATFSYIESRGGQYDKLVFCGLQYIVYKYLNRCITQDDIDEARQFASLHGEPFNEEGWNRILNEFGGKLPVTIRAPREGSVIPTHNVLVTIESAPGFGWLTSYIETFLLRVWFPITVSTVSWQIKELILGYFQDTVDPSDYPSINFKLHDFGARGTSSQESAMIGGFAHLVNFMGSDNVEGVWTANHFYHSDMAAFSIPALEHSVTTAFGKDKEVECFRNALQVWGGQGKVLACVSDTYDIYNAVEHLWGEQLKQEVIDSGSVVVVRPDSGDPVDVVLRVVQLLADKFGYTVNSKGYKVLNYVRVIQGDGIDYAMINSILSHLTYHKFSASNVAFGMGGALLQQVNRDTQRFAMKTSAVLRGGVWAPVCKNPITDPGKASKSGRLTLVRHKTTGEYRTVSIEPADIDVNVTRLTNEEQAQYEQQLHVVYDNGVLYPDGDNCMSEVRARADAYHRQLA